MMIEIRGANVRFNCITRPEQPLVVVTPRGAPQLVMAASYRRLRGAENPVLLAFTSAELAKRVAPRDVELVTVCARSAARRAFDELRMDMVVVHEFDEDTDAWQLAYLSRQSSSWSGEKI